MDFELWMIMEKQYVNQDYYTNLQRPIKSSSISSVPYTAGMYNRAGTLTDPWISLEDHGTSIANENILYGANSYAGAHSLSI